jgi:hypothetical protein
MLGSSSDLLIVEFYFNHLLYSSHAPPVRHMQADSGSDSAWT